MTKLTYIFCCLACASSVGSTAAAAVQPGNRERAVAIDRIPMVADEAADVERLASGLRRPWSLAFTPDDELLITEKYSGVRLMRDGMLRSAVLPGGPPQVLAKADSGLLDIALDPDFAANRLLYLAFAEGDEQANRLALWQARFDGARLADGQVIFRAQPDKVGTGHPGGRILFLPDKTLLLTVGDGYDYKAAAQDPGSHLGKTLRLTREGRAPDDNPFAGRAGFLAEIWTLGHRNAQGLTRDAETGEIWLHEHGPRGGDELNLLRAGANYGWPVVTHGIDYDGKLIAERASAPGFERAHFFWAPSIAPSGLLAYRGNTFPDWRGRLFVGALAYRSIVRLRRGKDTGLFVEEARMFVPLQQRIRDLREGPDGLIYVLTDAEDGELLRLRPKSPAK